MRKKLNRSFLILVKFAVSLVLIILGLLEAFSIIRIDAGTLALLGLAIALWTFPYLRESIRSIELPNGIKLELKPVIEDIKQRAIASGFISESHVGLGGGGESGFSHGLFSRDPKLGLASIRIGLEKQLTELGKLAEMSYATVYGLIEGLVHRQFLSRDEATILDKSLSILDESIRGSRIISIDDAWALFLLGEKLEVGLIKNLQLRKEILAAGIG